jgi:hypothetical protein
MFFNLMVSCNSLNVRASTPKPNPCKCSIYNTHYWTLRNLKSTKNELKLGKLQKKIYKSVTKNTHLWTAKPAPHTWVSFLGQVGMHKYSSRYPLAHTIIPKGTQIIILNILELPPRPIREEPP